ncbi:hypothetical protein LZD49_32725 [Dyadobacter sp. CY261]|uniref:hypothetical protein n=1 Tax=Dyadobacter sp. CY261 TaxID=2907203 RepID=UPI001F22B83A|nr:hypothetical protein [Dyadobacter sp. CY261]MCF0075289.1 hypothetical protein [Dyadobacter sp. CY261]
MNGYLYRPGFRQSIIFMVAILSLSEVELAGAAAVKVVLTGNTADFKRPDDLFDIVKNHIRQNTDQDTLVWVLNGDVFPETYSDEQILNWKTRANSLLEANPRLFILLNQGDRDWMDSGKGGWQKVRSIEKLLLQAGHPHFQVFLQQGCPGPWVVSFPNLEVIVINSQWWNHPFDKPSPTSVVCPISDTDHFIEELRATLDDTKAKNVLILSHFPLVSLGNYGGRFPASAYLVPPKVAFRQTVGTSKDIVNQQFEAFRYRLSHVLHEYPSVIFASGHEMNQSILKVGNNFYINSGALASAKFAAKSKNALLSSSETGVVEVTYNQDGQVGFAELGLSEGQLSVSKKGILINIPVAKSQVYRGSDQQRNPDGQTTVAAGPEYASGWFKRVWFGRHYRYSWTTPVQVPYLDADTTFGGLTFVAKGGGRQTTSLKLSAGNGKEYVFRSVNKDPYRALDFELKGTVIADVLKDQTSTQQPYGAMAVAPLMDKIGVLHATPKLYVLPDDERLGAFRAGYAHLFGMLEERPNDKIAEGKVFARADDIEQSYKMFRKLYQDHDNYINKEEFARARIFDLWIGDWSKHEDNWKWAGTASKGGKVFRPVPRDRDHAFSRWDGIIPCLDAISFLFVTTWLITFFKTTHVRGLCEKFVEVPSMEKPHILFSTPGTCLKC